MKKILLPTDFSDNAWNAIVYALEFFKNEACEFHILHTYTPTFYRADYMIGGPIYTAIPDVGVDIAQAGLDKTLVDIKLKFKNPKHKFKAFSAFNTLTNEVTELTETKDFDLIVMGTQGATGAKEIFLGTHTVHVLRKSKIPVLVIPKGCTSREIKSILFPTDYATPYKKEDLQYILDVAKMHHAKLTILNVKDNYSLTDGQIANQKSLADYFGALDHEFKQIKGQLMPDAIHEFVSQHNIALLAMMNRKHSFLERLRVKPNVDSIGYHTKIPFLAIRDTWEEHVKK